MKKIFLIFFIIFLAGFVLQCASDKTIKKDDASFVMTTGEADIRSAGVAEAYDRAISDGQRKAVEQAIGTVVSGETKTENGMFLKEEIADRSTGYIKKRKIIKKWREGSMVYVQAEYQVGVDKLKEDVLALTVAQKRMKMPKVILFINESYLGKVSNGITGTAYNELIKKFNEKKFLIVNRSAQLSSTEKKMLSNLKNGNELSALSVMIGKNNNADIVIVGSAKAQPAGTGRLYGTDMKSYQATLDVQAINVSDGRVLATSTKSGAAPHINAEVGCANAILRVSDSAADDLITQILASWEDILNNGNLLTLNVKGLSVTEGFKFQKALEKYFREIKEIYSKKMTSGTSQFLVKFTGNGKDFAMALSTVDFGYTVEVLSFDAATVSIQIK